MMLNPLFQSVSGGEWQTWDGFTDGWDVQYRVDELDNSTDKKSFTAFGIVKSTVMAQSVTLPDGLVIPETLFYGEYFLDMTNRVTGSITVDAGHNSIRFTQPYMQGALKFFCVSLLVQ